MSILSTLFEKSIPLLERVGFRTVATEGAEVAAKTVAESATAVPHIISTGSTFSGIVPAIGAASEQATESVVAQASETAAKASPSAGVWGWMSNTLAARRIFYKADMPLAEKLAALSKRGDAQALDYTKKLLQRAGYKGISPEDMKLIDQMSDVRLPADMKNQLRAIYDKTAPGGVVQAARRVVGPVGYALSNPVEATVRAAQKTVTTPFSLAASGIKDMALSPFSAKHSFKAGLGKAFGAAALVGIGDQVVLDGAGRRTTRNAIADNLEEKARENKKNSGLTSINGITSGIAGAFEHSVASVVREEEPGAAPSAAQPTAGGGAPDSKVDSGDPDNNDIVGGIEKWALENTAEHPFLARIAMALMAFLPLQMLNSKMLGNSEIVTTLAIVTAVGAAILGPGMLEYAAGAQPQKPAAGNEKDKPKPDAVPVVAPLPVPAH